MVIKPKKGFYDGLSRKELQTMCKRSGLPANKSHSELEKSLLACLEEGISGSICNSQKESQSKCKGRSINHKKTHRKGCNEKTLSFLREDVVEFRPLIKDRDKVDGPPENTFTFPIESSTKSRQSPFEFYVRSDEGISLCVDLNSSPSDWTEKLKNEVHIFDNVHSNKSRTLHEDLGSLKEGDKDTRDSHWRISGDMKEKLVETQSSPNALLEKMDQSKFDSIENGEDSLGKSNEDQPPVACNLNSNSQDHIISVVDSCAKAGCTMVCDSDIVDGHDDGKSSHDTPVNCLSNPLNRVNLEHTTSNLSRSENKVLQYDSSLPSLAAVDHGCSVSSSFEMQSSEVASCNKDGSHPNCESGEQMGGFDPKHDAGSDKANSSELNLDVCGTRLPVPAEEGERSNNLNERENSECSRLTRASGKKCLNPDKLNSKVESEHRRGYANSNIKILRSMKRMTRREFPRRSTRLLSK